MTIELPERIQEQNALAALSSLIHEASHMKYSIEIPRDLAKSEVDHFIINAMEDVRIDRKNYDMLPNIYDFYEKFIKDHVCSEENKKSLAKQHMLTRCMVQCIIQEMYFSKYCWDQEALEFIKNNDIYTPFHSGIYFIDDHRWDDVTRCIEEIKSKFKFDSNPKKEEKKDEGGTGNGDKQSKGTGSRESGCSGDNTGSGGGGKDNNGNDNGPPKHKGKPTRPDNEDSKVGTGNSLSGVEDPGKFLSPGTVWGKGDGLRGPGGLEFNSIELEETTKRRFVDTLSMKEKIVTSDGQKLDTDNLIALFTGQIDELFKEEDEEKKKNSKIVFCLDASRSMGTKLFDKTSRRKTLVKCVKSLTDILDEVKETEGLNVDYDIIAFNSVAHKLEKGKWTTQYFDYTGGTSIYAAVDMAIDILKNVEIDGNKTIILVTDGDVRDSHVEEVKKLILQNNSDIKAMLLGIGASLNGPFVRDICGDNNIMCLEHASQIIMEAIQTMLEG